MDFSDLDLELLVDCLRTLGLEPATSGNCRDICIEMDFRFLLFIYDKPIGFRILMDGVSEFVGVEKLVSQYLSQQIVVDLWRLLQQVQLHWWEKHLAQLIRWLQVLDNFRL